jgi:hypothetical protein
MANALHFFRDKEHVLRHLRGYLKPNGKFILVEYNVDAGKYVGAPPFLLKAFALASRRDLTSHGSVAKPSVPAQHLFSVAASLNAPIC